MPKLFVAVVACVAGYSTASLAQNLTAGQREACKADYQKYCSGVMPGGGRILVCLKKQYQALGEACKKVVDAQ